ncbi:MAG TPA: hypothetical protein V6C76_15940 [Drouetiella sp.]
MFDAPPANPQSVGDVIGRGFRLLRQHIPLMVREQIVPCIIMATGHSLFQFAVTYGLKNPKDLPMLGAGLLAILLGTLTVVLGFWFLTIKLFAFVRLACGLAVNFEEAKQAALKRKWNILGFYLLTSMIICAAIVFWLIVMVLPVIAFSKVPAIAVSGMLIGLAGLIVSAGLISVYYGLTNAALAIEEDRWLTLIKRASALVTNDLGRACGFAILLSVIVSVLSYTLSLPIVALAVFELFRSGFPANHADPTTAMPFYLLVLSQFWQAMINMFLLPISFMSGGLFYRDLKIRQEGLDVVQRIKQLTAVGARQ